MATGVTCQDAGMDAKCQREEGCGRERGSIKWLHQGEERGWKQWGVCASSLLPRLAPAGRGAGCPQEGGGGGPGNIDLGLEQQGAAGRGQAS